MTSHLKNLRHGMYLPTPQERMRCINLDISSFDDDLRPGLPRNGFLSSSRFGISLY